MRLALLLASMILMGCPPSDGKKKKPEGTPTDPVEVCERLADVCRHQGSQLGVCTQRDDSTLYCMPQH